MQSMTVVVRNIRGRRWGSGRGGARRHGLGHKILQAVRAGDRQPGRCRGHGERCLTQRTSDLSGSRRLVHASFLLFRGKMRWAWDILCTPGRQVPLHRLCFPRWSVDAVSIFLSEPLIRRRCLRHCPWSRSPNTGINELKEVLAMKYFVSILIGASLLSMNVAFGQSPRDGVLQSFDRKAPAVGDELPDLRLEWLK